MRQKNKLSEDPNDVEDTKPPSFSPPQHFIQTTFLYRDVSELDKEYSQSVIERLNLLRSHLMKNAKVTIDNENIDCGQEGFVKCKEYPTKDGFHFLIIEDSAHGAAIYTIPRVLNRDDLKIEVALLDALSRHSLYSLMSFASKEAELELGFIKELSQEELEEMSRDRKEGERQEKKDQEKATKNKVSKIFTRGPFEMDLVDEKILEFREIEEPTDFGKLEKFGTDQLNNAIEQNDVVFVMFWSKANPISLHAIKLWIDASHRLYNVIIGDPRKIKIGHVSCFDDAQVCELFGVGRVNQHYLFMYENGRVSLNSPNMKDGIYYEEWVQMMLDGIVVELEDEEAVENAMKGNMVGFSGKRQAITIGIFPSNNCPEFEVYEKVAKLLRGKYHFVFHQNPEASPTIVIVRGKEDEGHQMRLYDGEFRITPIIEFIGFASIPNVLDLSGGFTNDVILKRNKIVIMIDNMNGKRKVEFSEVVSKYITWETGKETLFGSIDYIHKNVPHDLMITKFDVDILRLPYIFVFEKNRFLVKSLKDEPFDIEKILQLKDSEYERRLAFPTHIVNPLRYLNLEKTNIIFGRQNVLLLADPVLEIDEDDEDADPHSFAKLDLSNMGGCPMAAMAGKMKMKKRDEL
uniref:Thioredoxin domain-containing protein n=1 Tax=Rhabditophanes sp. KR3021 TaxID=114890 RepID=A0AC35TRL1_9BILA